MAVRILMPALSPTMTEGAVAKWLKAEGDAVASGDVIAEIETDKATVELEAVEAGVLAKRLVAEGAQGIKVNDVIAILREEGDDDAAVAAASSGAPSGEPSGPSAGKPPAPAAKEETQEKVAGPAARESAGDHRTGKPAPGAERGKRLFASPLARRIARERGIDLGTLSGSGPHGRIIRKDVESAPKGRVAHPAAAPETDAYRDEPVTTFRRTVAERMTESVRTIPHFYLSLDCRIDALLALRQEINALDEAKVSVNDLVIRAAALALAAYPAANVAWMGEAIRHYETADIAVAVATPRGLITPIIRGAERKPVTAIGREMRDLAARAREGKLKPAEYQGGTFTISNLGMFGIRQFDAIINPPQACLLAVGAGARRPVVAEDGGLSVETLMTVTLAVDHRAVDGAIGAEYLGVFRKLVEAPLRLLV